MFRGPARRREGRLPTEGNLHRKGGDNPAQKAREVCKQRKTPPLSDKGNDTPAQKGRERPEQRKKTYSGVKDLYKGKTYTGDAESLHTEGESRAKNLQTTAGGIHTKAKH